MATLATNGTPLAGKTVAFTLSVGGIRHARRFNVDQRERRGEYLQRQSPGFAAGTATGGAAGRGRLRPVLDRLLQATTATSPSTSRHGLSRRSNQTADISWATPLGATQLDATASVAEPSSTLPVSGTVLSGGTSQSLDDLHADGLGGLHGRHVHREDQRIRPRPVSCRPGFAEDRDRHGLDHSVGPDRRWSPVIPTGNPDDHAWSPGSSRHRSRINRCLQPQPAPASLGSAVNLTLANPTRLAAYAATLGETPTSCRHQRCSPSPGQPWHSRHSQCSTPGPSEPIRA